MKTLLCTALLSATMVAAAQQPTHQTTPQHPATETITVGGDNYYRALAMLETGCRDNLTGAMMPRPEAEWLADAIWRAEGGYKSSRPYGLRKGTRSRCLDRLDREWREWLQAGCRGRDFVEWIAVCWAPQQINDEEDPKHLNQYWADNVRKIYLQIANKKR